jgi:hypothetical protein
VFAYATERTGSVYHVDSFYVERLIVTGVLGLTLVGISMWRLLRRVDATGRAIVLACMVYASAENTVFNVTSAFAFFSILLAAAARSDPAPASAPTRPTSEDAPGHTIGSSSASDERGPLEEVNPGRVTHGPLSGSVIGSQPFRL